MPKKHFNVLPASPGWRVDWGGGVRFFFRGHRYRGSRYGKVRAMAMRVGMTEESADRARFGGLGRWSFAGKQRLMWRRGIIDFPKRGIRP